MNWDEIANNNTARAEVYDLALSVWKLSLLLEQQKGSGGRSFRIDYIRALRAQGLSWRAVARFAYRSASHVAKLAQTEPYPAPQPSPVEVAAAEAAQLDGWAAIVNDILRDHPEAWCGVSTSADVAMPWERRKAALGAAVRARAGNPDRSIAQVDRTRERIVTIENGIRRDSPGEKVWRVRIEHRRLPENFDTIEAAMTAADAELDARGIVLL